MKGNTHIVAGISSIANSDNAKTGIDLAAMEAEMIKNGQITQSVSTVDPLSQYQAEMSELARNFGLSFGEFKPPPTPSSSFGQAPPPANSFAPIPRYQDDSFSSMKRPSDTPYPDSSAQYENSRSDDDDEDADDNYDSASTYPVSIHNMSDELRSKTFEQQRKDQIRSVMGKDTSTTNFSLETEKQEDLKSEMLADIDSLLTVLKECDVDVSRIPEVDRNSSFEEISSVMKILRLKNDKTRYCTLAEECILFGAHAIEELFDGKRSWLGMKIDAVGWHNHVIVRLRRMRHDTGQLVSSVMQGYGMSYGWRIFLELFPNFILYTKSRQNQHHQPSLFNEADMHSAGNNMRNLT